MTFLNQLRDIAARAAHSTEPGRIVAELANAIADNFEAQTTAFNEKIASLEFEIESLQTKLNELTASLQA